MSASPALQASALELLRAFRQHDDLEVHTRRLTTAIGEASPGRMFVGGGSGGDAVIERWIQDHLALEASLAQTTASRDAMREAAHEALTRAREDAKALLDEPAPLRSVTIGGIATAWLQMDGEERQVAWIAIAVLADVASARRGGLDTLVSDLSLEVATQVPLARIGLPGLGLALLDPGRRALALTASLATLNGSRPAVTPAAQTNRPGDARPAASRAPGTSAR